MDAQATAFQKNPQMFFIKKAEESPFFIRNIAEKSPNFCRPICYRVHPQYSLFIIIAVICIQKKGTKIDNEGKKL